MISAVANAASYNVDSVSPGLITVIYGTGLGPAELARLQLDSQARVSTSLAGVTVTFDGVAAPLIYVSATQLSAVAPYAIASRSSTDVRVSYLGQVSDPVTKRVTPTVPGLFSLDSSGRGGGAIVNSDGSINSSSRPAMPGDYVQVYLTGEGVLQSAVETGAIATGALATAATATAQIGGTPATVLYTGAAPGNLFGLAQMNVTIPAAAPPGNLPLSITVGSVAAQTGVTVAVGGSAPAQLTTVFLLHGINQTNEAMQRLRASLTGPAGLDATRYRVDAGFDYGECTASAACAANCSIAAGAAKLASYITAANPPGPIALIGFSLGGLIAREWIAGNPPLVSSGRIATLVTLATPNLGYPYSSFDGFGSCGRLSAEMDGNWRAQQAQNAVVLSPYLSGLTTRWANIGFTRSQEWLTAAGRSCREPSRVLFPSTGCRDANPLSDGVVCDDSASYFAAANIMVPAGAAPTRRWQDPAGIYVHSHGTISNFILCGNTGDPVRNPLLFDPPVAGPLFGEIKAAVERRSPPQILSSLDLQNDPYQVLNLSPSEQVAWLRQIAEMDFPVTAGDALTMLVLNREEIALPILEQFVINNLADSARSQAVAIAGEMIAYPQTELSRQIANRVKRLPGYFNRK